jgi:transglutaminase-like putative cysteine protease
MYTINQFKPTLYALLLLGMLGFGLASESPGVWALGTGGILLNAWLVKTRRFTPMPRLLANLVTIGSMLYVAREVFAPGTTAVMVIGKFLVLLQLIKLWEQRANRDYAQLIVLSLLLMVAASINTTSLIFALMLVVYLFLSLYCCLLFHLKVETDSAHATFPVPVERLSPSTLRQDKRFLGRSMRRLTGVVSAIGIATAVAVFLLFPRGAGAGMFGPLQLRPSQALTGFSETVSFQTLARITQNHAEVANVEVWRNGEPVDGTETLMLRGVTLDRYNTVAGIGGRLWQWGLAAVRNDEPRSLLRGEPWRVAQPERGDDLYRQQVQLFPTGTQAMFAMGGVIEVTPRREMKVRYDAADGAIRSNDALMQSIRYEVVSTNAPFPAEPMGPKQRRLAGRRRAAINPAILKYALRPEVGGVDAAGRSLAQQRLDSGEDVHELDEQIARNIERHLQTSFAYTLDLTDAAKLKGDEDPMVAFLTQLKRGHCEYFAGAMTLMCQSLGMQARLVNGFKCDEFNSIGTGYYIVRQSHAHSWVEVQTLREPDDVTVWSTFDPTSSREDGAGGDGGAWQQVKHLFNFLEFTYANAVIGYDNDNRDSLVASLDAGLQNGTYRGLEWVNAFRRWLDGGVWSLSNNLLNALAAVMAVGLAAFVAWFLWERWMLRRKAARIGLDRLPTAEQLRLARQLGFYDDLMQLLARHRITRPAHLTPLEFSRTLMFLPSEAYDTVRRLTEVFYRVRYGHSELSGGQRRRLGEVIARLEPRLAATPAPGAAMGA